MTCGAGKISHNSKECCKVTNSLRLGSVVALLSALAIANSSLAQGPPQRPAATQPPQGGGPAYAGAAQPLPGGPAGGVAIIDLPYILKNHGGFNQQLEGLRREAEAVENDFKSKRDGLQKMVTQLEELNRGSPDYKKLEEEITKRNANMTVEFNIKKKQFQEAEAKIYYQVYQQILNEVTYYAEANRISLVLKFNADAANKDNPEEIMREMQKMVLYYNQAIDITPIILERMKGQKPAAGGAAAAQRPLPPGGPPRRTQ